MRDRAHTQPGQVADRVEGHLRVVGAGLQAQVTAGPVRVEVLVGQHRQRPQGRRFPARQIEALAEHGRAVSNRDREPCGGEAGRLAGVGRRCAGVRGWPGRPSAGHQLRGPGPFPQQVPQVAPGHAVGQAQCAERQPVLGGGNDAGLVRAVEGDRCRVRGRPRRSGAGRRPGRAPAQGAGQQPGADRPGPAEQPAPGHPAPGRTAPGRTRRGRSRRPRLLRRSSRLAHLPDLSAAPAAQLTLAGIPDSASAKAFTAPDSCRRCAWVTSV